MGALGHIGTGWIDTGWIGSGDIGTGLMRDSSSYTPPYADGGVVAGWSTRLLRPGYTGNCLRAMRVADSVEADYGFGPDGSLDIAGIDAWAPGGWRVATWMDQSGSAYDATQGTAANRPTGLSIGSESGRPALSFDGSNDSLVGPAFAQAQPFVIILVSQYPGAGQHRCFVMSSSRVATAPRIAGAAFQAGGGAAQTFGGLPSAQTLSLGITANAAASMYHREGASSAFPANPGGSAISGVEIGYSPFAYTVGKIMELVVLPGDPGDAAVRAYVANAQAWFGGV